MKERTKNIFVRVTEQEKNRIGTNAKNCDLSVSEYLRKRALGYSPRAVLPDAFYVFYEKLCELCNFVDGKISTDTEEKLLRLIDDIQLALILPVKETTAQIKTGLEVDKRWRQQDSGQSKET